MAGENGQDAGQAPKRMTIDEVAATIMAPIEDEPKKKRSASQSRPANGDAARADGKGAASDAGPDGGQRRQQTRQQVENDADDDDDDGADDATDDRRNKPVTDEDYGPDDDGDDGEDGGPDEDDDPLDDSIFAEADERDDEDGDTDDLDTSKLRDDLVLSVTVDGEEVGVTLGDLKRRYAGEGAIQKRLQEATEVRTTVLQDYEKSRQLTQQVLQQFGKLLFKRTVPEPPKELQTSNPTQYLIQKNLFDEETAALQAGYGQLHQVMGQLDELNAKAMKERRAAAAQELRRIMPVFADKEKGPKVRRALIDAAKEIGYTEKQIAACEDPLMFKTVALAARELRRQKGLHISKATEKVRTMKANGSSNRTKQGVQQRRDKAALVKARKTGKVDDVAATMLVKAPRNSRDGRRS